MKEIKESSGKKFIFDITHEEIQNKKRVDDIALNGSKLIREQLTISEKRMYLLIIYAITVNNLSANELQEYVYDIYYAPRDVCLDEEMIIEGYEYFNNEVDNEEKPDWEEEEDSNDEDNWRNDYPDERYGYLYF